MTSMVEDQQATYAAEAFKVKLSQFDRIGFGLAMRAIEVRLLFDQPHHDDAAIEILRRFIADRTMHLATMESLCSECLPLRLANVLETRGIRTLHDLASQTYYDLLAIPNVSDRSIGQMRRVIEQVIAGNFVVGLDDSYDTLQPDWDVDVDDLRNTAAKTYHNEKTHMASTTLKDALAVLLNAGPEAVAEIDREIARKNAELEELKRMRKIVSPTPILKNGTHHNEGLIALEGRVFELVKDRGAMKSSAIAEVIGGSTTYIAVGRAVARSARLCKRGGLVALL